MLKEFFEIAILTNVTAIIQGKTAEIVSNNYLLSIVDHLSFSKGPLQNGFAPLLWDFSKADVPPHPFNSNLFIYNPLPTADLL